MRAHLQSARRGLDEARRQAYEEQLQIQRASELAAVRALEDSLLAAWGGKRAGYYASNLNSLREVFESYAELRGPLLVELTTLVGFPDPDPESRRTSSSRTAQARYERAARIRVELRELENQFQLAVVGVLADIEALAAEERRQIGIQLAAALEEADRKAQEVASRLLVPKDQPALLATRTQFRLDSVAGAEKTIPASQALPAVPEVQAPEHVSEAELLRHDLEVWLKTRGYELAAGGRNATQEFIEWRRDRDGR